MLLLICLRKKLGRWRWARLAYFPVFMVFLGLFVLSLSGPLFLFTRPGFTSYLGMVEKMDYSKERLTPWQLAQLGHVADSQRIPTQSYLRFPFEKNKNVYRIGFFGDSHVQGEEVALGEDLTNHLQQELALKDGKKVEVINFGVSGYGFFQSFLMWQFLGQKYDLDLCIFMPFEFHQSRDLNFVSPHFNGFVPAHARFTNSAHGPKLLPVKGVGLAQKKYYSPLGSWQSWRYEVAGPSFWRFLNRPNPLYHDLTNSPHYESFSLYTQLLQQVALKSKTLVYAPYQEADLFAPFTMPAGAEIFVSRAIPFIRDTRSWFLAPKGHLSSFGNRLLARELALWISSKKVVSAQELAQKFLRSGFMTGEEKYKKLDSTDTQTIGGLQLQAQNKNLKINLGALREVQFPTSTLNTLNPFELGQKKINPILAVFPAEIFGELTVVDFTFEEALAFDQKSAKLVLKDEGREEVLGQLKNAGKQVYVLKTKNVFQRHPLAKGTLWLGKLSLGPYSRKDLEELRFPLHRRGLIFRAKESDRPLNEEFWGQNKEVNLIVNLEADKAPGPTALKTNVPLYNWAGI